MMTALRGWSLGCVLSGALLSTISAQGAEDEGVVRLGSGAAAGVVRISDQTQSSRIFRGQSAEADSASPTDVMQASQEVAQMANCEIEPGSVDAGNCPPSYVVDENCRHGHGCKKSYWLGQELCGHWTWFNGKCAGQHRGNHGPGRPLAGCYNMVYPVDPGYFDRRDGQVYAAPGYGGPVSVPLAPVVNSTYNYGWGIPSSRLTPVLHPAVQAPVSQIPSPYPTAPVSY